MKKRNFGEIVTYFNRRVDEMKKIKINNFHFAWDNYADGDKIIPKLIMFMEKVKPAKHSVVCYCLTNFDTTIKQDLKRIYILRDLSIQPYVMIYDKEHCNPIYRKMQRWVNSPRIFWITPKFEEYERM